MPQKRSKNETVHLEYIARRLGYLPPSADEGFRTFREALSEEVAKETTGWLNRDELEAVADKAEELLEEENDPTSLYRFFDSEGTLLYAGITCRGPKRFRQHSRDKEWWDEVATATIEHFPDRPTAELREAEVIRDENPRHNIARPTAVRVERTTRPSIQRPRFDPLLLPTSGVKDALEKQARRHFKMSAEELIQAWESEEISQDDERLFYVANLLAEIRVQDAPA